MTRSFAARLVAWQQAHGRHDLPWQGAGDPYRVWLSEIMLQQTQVATVIPYFLRFVEAFSDVRALAAAPIDRVLELWSGLGYYRRAHHLHDAAKRVVAEHEGDFPRDAATLALLPGIGRSTAAAIAALAFGARTAILDGNVKRVLARLHGVEGWPGTPAVEKRLWALAEAQLPPARMADYTQAQMDFGATLCTRFDPACVVCPLQQVCVALQTGRVAELPTPKPGKSLPERSALVLLLTAGDGRILLQRRPSSGGWAALWSLPEAGDHASAREWFAQHVDADYDGGEPLAAIDHGFTHYRLQLQPVRWRQVAGHARVADNGDLRWVRRDELATLGIPAPIRKLLEDTTA